MPRNISPEFKRECAELVIIHGYKHKDAAAAMGVGLSSIQAEAIWRYTQINSTELLNNCEFKS
ncbi:transposase [Vibrio sp. Isolate23]|uniref:transposase n=1 Tax=Vibrio sp. Isolate23 TaxID=2908533 RepID=UPI001EFD9DD8|nr:transposase [Vibrio sp. Isolate23]MCG9682338.1 transposase [Vibrio sp. Isolate23]